MSPADYLTWLTSLVSKLATKIMKCFGFGSGKMQKNGLAGCVI